MAYFFWLNFEVEKKKWKMTVQPFHSFSIQKKKTNSILGKGKDFLKCLNWPFCKKNMVQNVLKTNIFDFLKFTSYFDFVFRLL